MVEQVRCLRCLELVDRTDNGAYRRVKVASPTPSSARTYVKALTALDNTSRLATAESDKRARDFRAASIVHERGGARCTLSRILDEHRQLCTQDGCAPAYLMFASDV